MALFLETERLVLKTPETAELQSLLALRADPKVITYLYISLESVETMTEEVKDFMVRNTEYYKKHGMGMLSVYEKQSDQFVGQAGIFHKAFDDSQLEVEIAYRLLSSFWQKGYATELSKALVHWGFSHLYVDYLTAFTHPDNKSSQHVLQKSGFCYTGMTVYRDKSVCRYAINKSV